MLVEVTQESLKSKLGKGILKFRFEKKDGTFRDARGTTSTDLIPTPAKTDGSGKCGNALAYFDNDILQWRSIAEGMKTLIDTESLHDLIGESAIKEEEVLLMLYNEGKLEDTWTADLIKLILTAQGEDLGKLAGCYKELSRVCWNFQDDQEYHESLLTKWGNLVG
jgi:hypothetical protein